MGTNSKINVQAFQIAQSFNIRKWRAEFLVTPHSGNNSELFYHFIADNRFLFVFDYGVVVMGNYDDEVVKSEFLKFAYQFAENRLERPFTEDYVIQVDSHQQKAYVANDVVTVHEISTEIVRIVMLNVAQSVALEYYEMLTDEMLTETKAYTQELEQKGSFSVSRKALMKFIGKVLNVKNSIVDNLYILDDPNLVWDNAELDHLNRYLKLNFDINARFKDLDYRLKIIEENLKMFADLDQSRESNRLEWIIIILIAVEIVNAFLRPH